jgi:uncharacterized membrane protein
MTFRWVAITAFAVVIGGIGLHMLLFPFSASGRWGLMDIFRTKIHAFTLLFLDQKLNWIARLKKLILLLAMLSFLILLITGFGPLFFGCRLAGWLLVIHATFAPILIGCISLLALGWAQGMVFREGIDRVLKGCFWLLIFLSLPLTLTMILSMFRFFGTDGQTLLLIWHRWCALAFGCIGLIFLYNLIRRQIGMENATEPFE